MPSHHARIYHSRRHVLVTLAIIFLPFIFLVFFSRLAHIALRLLLTDLFVSTFRLLIAFVVAAGLAWLSAVLFFKGRRAVIALPLFDVLQSFPTFAALPLATYFWGTSNFTVIFFLVLTVIWPIFFAIISSLKLVKHDWEEAVELYGLRGWQYIRKFLLPVSIPGLITGSIVGLGEGWEAVVATEIIVHIKPGLGQFFEGVQTNPSITEFGILGLLLFIFSINKLVWLPLLERSHRLLEE